ncbi:helix-turn-helix domain-containing protein [Halomonas binhaiensis]|uniref:Helix-turn-helix domain-containing protein n=1 Tax=Halomonas binhaiensis TaxID=2562282 RepID=A0A5C1NMU0_9GAMM|nr:helix-turn-helix transcriptional regulator [Halomonas binhaiensis]QEM83757.1 helix-turn-helix domain-containing protein [Halomonas binhaiensis]
MARYSLHSAAEVQQDLVDYLRACRKAAKLSRTALAERSAVLESTIKKFETTEQVLLRQFLLLWQNLDDLVRLQGLTEPESPTERMPTSIDEVLSR